MAQFSLYRNEDTGSCDIYPYFIDVQNPLLSDLNSRLVIPLSPLEVLNEIHAERLCPVVHLDGGDFVLLTHQMTAVPSSILKTEITSLEPYRYEILAAIDMLISGI